MSQVQIHPHSNFIDCGSHENIVRFTADAKGGPERLWFDFDITPEESDGSEIRLELHHCHSLLGGRHVNGTLLPVWKSDDQDWVRLTNIKRTVLDDGRFVFSWSVPTPKRSGRLAACFPYALTDLETFMEKSSLRRDTVGVSARGRHFPRISNRIDDVDSQRPGVFISARQHAGETPGSFILEGILESFAEQRDDDPMVWALPFIDLDGVEEGRYGKNHFPLDHNRSWYQGGLCHETQIAMQESQRWASRCKPTIYLDLHAPGFMEEDLYFFSGTEQPDSKMKTFLTICEESLGEYSSQNFIRQSDYQKVMNQKLGLPGSMSANIFFKEKYNCISTTNECTYQAFNGVAATQDDYRSIGRVLAESIRKYCQSSALSLAPAFG